MNPKLSELYRQAHLGTKDADGKNPQYFSAERFAELIIRESVQFLSDAGCDFEAEQLDQFWND